MSRLCEIYFMQLTIDLNLFEINENTTCLNEYLNSKLSIHKDNLKYTKLTLNLCVFPCSTEIWIQILMI